MIPLPGCSGTVAARLLDSRANGLLVRLAMPVFLGFILSGCATRKVSWNDWMKEGTAHSGPIAVTLPPQPAPITNGFAIAPRYKVGDGARVSPGYDLKMRHPDFPRTYIEMVYVDLSTPTRGVYLRWTGPEAALGPVGPWRHTPGRGAAGLDCDDVDISNTVNSLCTPKGTFPVAGFADHLEQTPYCRYATWVVHAPRYIAIHSHFKLPEEPASAGCLRVPIEAAKLIHNNSRVGLTVVHITGTWHRSDHESGDRPIVLAPSGASSAH